MSAGRWQRRARLWSVAHGQLGESCVEREFQAIDGLTGQIVRPGVRVEGAVQFEKLARGHTNQCLVLWHVPYLPQHGDTRAFVPGVQAENLDETGCWPGEPHQHADGGRLARTVAPQQSINRTSGHSEREAVDGAGW